MHNGEAPAADGTPHEKANVGASNAATAGSKQGMGPSRVVEVDARKLYTDDSALVGLRVQVSIGQTFILHKHVMVY